MSNINKKVSNAAKWSMIAEIIAKLIAPITNMILARILAPNAFGAVATITLVISFADIFTDAGFQKYIVQHEFDSHEDFDKSVNVAFWSNLMLSVTMVVSIFIFRNKLAEFAGSPDLAVGMAVASFSIIMTAFSSIQMSVYKRKLDFKTLFQVRMITSLVPLVITVPLAFFVRNYWSLVVGTLIMNCVQAVILMIKSDWKPRRYYSWEKFKEMFSFTSWTLAETISIWMTSYIGTFIIGRNLNSYYLGLYKTSMTTVNAYMGIITSGITPVLFSALSRYQNDDKMFKNTYFSFQKYVAMALMPMGIGLYIFRDLATEILLGKQWMEASRFIGLWALMSSMTIIYSHFSSEVYRSKGKPKISLIAQLIHLVFLVPTLMISVRYGFKVLYISRSLIRLQLVAVSLIVMHNVFQIKVGDIIKNTIIQVFSAVVMGLFAYWIKDLNSSLIWQFIAIMLSAMIYISALCMFPSMRKEIKNFKIGKIKRRERNG